MRWTSLIPLVLFSLLACRKDDTGGPPDPEDTQVTQGEVRVGVSCPRMERVGVIQLSLYDSTVSLGGVIYDAPQPITGVPALDNEHCVYHRYDASACGACGAPLVCSGEGECVPMPTPFTDLDVTLTDGETWNFASGDPQGGWLYEQWEHGGEDWAMRVAFGQDLFEAPAMPIAAGLEGVTVTVESSDEWAPGALEASWTPMDDGSLVRSEIPINHHAQAGTFTLCEAGAEQGGFRADAEMIDPLAVVTGLEFQGLWHLQVASVETSVGCVELQYGAQLYVSPTSP
jgi:hypothetical protein